MLKKVVAFLFISVLATASLKAAFPPPVEDTTNQQVLSLYMKRGNYLPSRATMQDTLYCGAAGKDTTMTYRLFRYTSVQAIVDTVGINADSVRVKLVYLIGDANRGQYRLARWDSTLITTWLANTPVTLACPVAGFLAVEATGYTGNGKNTKVQLILNRDGRNP